MKITWEVDFGDSQSYKTEIPDDILEGLDEAELEQTIEDWVQAEFEEHITWCIAKRED